MQSTSLSAIEREIIADIHAVCRRCGWPTNVRPKLDAYLYEGGDVYEKQIKRLGGWKKLCARGGMHGVAVPALPVRREALAPDFDTVVADLRRVAQSLRLRPGARLTRAVYRRSGGLYYDERVINEFGGWAALSAAAGVPSGRGGQTPQPRHPWRKTQPTLTEGDFDAALDHALGRTPVPRGILCMMGRKRHKRLKAVHREVPELARGEVIADIRQVALSVGLFSPHLLSFETYRRHGGRYTHEQTLALGGFSALRRAA